MTFFIQRLQEKHDLFDFDCENKALNDYLLKYALQNQKRDLSNTYVALKNKRVIGYYSLATGSVRPEGVPKKVSRGLPKYDIPVLLLARLAVDVCYQGKGVGKGLLKDALIRCAQVSKIVGMRALIVHAKDENAAEFYKRFDFDPSPTNPLHLFLPMKTIQKNIGPDKTT